MCTRKQQNQPSPPPADLFSRGYDGSINEIWKELDTMKFFIAPIVISTLALAAASPVAAQSKPASDQGVSVGTANSHDPAAERRSYTQTAQNEMKLWQQKLLDFDAKMQAKATDAKTRTSKDLDDTWTETKSAYSQLETAGEADWNSAKASFKTASAKLAVTWQKVNPAGK
jgi:hypothetical protein